MDGFKGQFQHSKVGLNIHLQSHILKFECKTITSVFCSGFQKGRVPSEKGTFSAVNGPTKGHN